MGFGYSFFIRSAGISSTGGVEWILKWIAIDPPGAPPIVRVVSGRRMSQLEARFGVLDPATIFTEAQIDSLLDPD